MSVMSYEAPTNPVSDAADRFESASSHAETPSNEGGTVVSAPPCLKGESLRRVEDLDSPTSRFYVGNGGLCLVEAVEVTDTPTFDLDGVLDRIERKLILFALEKTGGARAGAARLMGISRSRLYRRIHALGLDNGNHPEDPSE